MDRDTNTKDLTPFSDRDARPRSEPRRENAAAAVSSAVVGSSFLLRRPVAGVMRRERSSVVVRAPAPRACKRPRGSSEALSKRVSFTSAI